MSLLPDWITGYDPENAARSAAADAELRRITAARIAQGDFYTPAEVANIRNDYINQDLALGVPLAAAERNYDDGLARYLATGDTSGFALAADAAFSTAAQRNQIDQTFNTELQARADSLIGQPIDFVGNLVAKILKAVPWWIWVGLGVAVFAWAGGFTWLARQTKGKLA